MNSSRIIVYLMFILSIIYAGCNTGNQKNTGSTDTESPMEDSATVKGAYEEYDDSVLIARGSFTDSLKDGLWTFWYKNGHLKAEGNYERGVKEGMWVEYYPDGTVMWKGEWENGERRILDPEGEMDIKFTGIVPQDDILDRNTLYHIQIRVTNVPSDLLFLEARGGEIRLMEAPDIYELKSTGDSVVTLSIGYIPDINNKDFRNLVRELRFMVE